MKMAMVSEILDKVHPIDETRSYRILGSTAFAIAVPLRAIAQGALEPM